MTTIIHSIEKWHDLRNSLSAEHSIGFVPTMGNLHEGHASLLARSMQENAFTILSIFVNPTQFNDKNDLARYPRTLEADLALARRLNVDYVLVPDAPDMYANGYQYSVSENSLSQILEGTFRPGHFDGMLTVVMKLFGLVRPHRAYFGEKDFQQLHLVQEMVKAFFLNIEIVACPTLRRPSGLPLSSRNGLLTKAELRLADEIATLFHQHDDIDTLKREIRSKNVIIDYLERWHNRLLYAIRIGSVRLIDNRQCLHNP